MLMTNADVLLTSRLEIRPPAEGDRRRLVDLMRDDEFMVFFDGARTAEQAHHWFDHMLAVCADVPFGKQPVIERASGIIVGYVGVDWFELDNDHQLEFGYRLAAEFRGMGYATEAGLALLRKAADSFTGEIFAIIDRDNHPSQNVARKLGFQFRQRVMINAKAKDLYHLYINSGLRADTK
jgi:RimJ/RimL family protein N-acetyltransferase